MLIFPAIDLYEGRCVRLTRGEFSTKKVYGSSPAEMAKTFARKGFTHLHVIDLEGAEQGSIINWDAISSIISASKLKVHIGGGIRNEEDVEKLLSIGANQVILGTVVAESLQSAESFVKRFGSDRIIVAADFSNGAILSHGWKKKRSYSPLKFMETLNNSGIEYFLSTDVQKDGVLKGPNIEFYKTILSDLPNIKLIASGGVSSISDVQSLKQSGLYGAVVGKAIYENLIELDDLAEI